MITISTPAKFSRADALSYAVKLKIAGNDSEELEKLINMFSPPEQKAPRDAFSWCSLATSRYTHIKARLRHLYACEGHLYGYNNQTIHRTPTHLPDGFYDIPSGKLLTNQASGILPVLDMMNSEMTHYPIKDLIFREGLADNGGRYLAVYSVNGINFSKHTWNKAFINLQDGVHIEGKFLRAKSEYGEVLLEGFL